MDKPNRWSKNLSKSLINRPRLILVLECLLDLHFGCDSFFAIFKHLVCTISSASMLIKLQILLIIQKVSLYLGCIYWSIIYIAGFLSQHHNVRVRLVTRRKMVHHQIANLEVVGAIDSSHLWGILKLTG